MSCTQSAITRKEGLGKLEKKRTESEREEERSKTGKKQKDKRRNWLHKHNLATREEKRREGQIRSRKRAENYRKIKKEKRVKTTREETRSEKKTKRLEYYKRKIDRRKKSRETNWRIRDESGSTQKGRRSGIDTRRGLKPKRRSFEKGRNYINIKKKLKKKKKNWRIGGLKKNWRRRIGELEKEEEKNHRALDLIWDLGELEKEKVEEAEKWGRWCWQEVSRQWVEISNSSRDGCWWLGEQAILGVIQFCRCCWRTTRLWLWTTLRIPVRKLCTESENWLATMARTSSLSRCDDEAQSKV